MPKYFVRILLCLCVLTGGAIAFGQNARFSGQVTDQQNAAVPNATVKAINQDSHSASEAKTDAEGNYVVPYLPSGRYRIKVEAPGFSPFQSKDLLLNVGQVLVYNIQLSIGSTEATVNVDAGASSAATQVETTNAEVSGTVTGKEVAGLQLNGRNFTQLITLVPGVSNQTQQDEAKVGVLGSVAYSVNGGRTEYNSFQVDGSETLNVGINKDHSTLLVYPSVDAIQEIKVLTSNYGAQYSSTGNATTLVTTKSGTNEFHGNVYEFIRNEAFNAKGYFDVTNGAPLYRRNDFGGTIGGPVILPHIYNGRNKTYFFFSEEARLEKSPTAFRQAVPSLAERAGDFSDVCPYAAPGSSNAFPGSAYPDCPGQVASFTNNNLTSVAPLSPSSLAILQTGIIPAPNSYTGCNGGSSPIGSCYLADVSLPTYYREELFRIDHQLSEKTQASFRYIHDEWDTTTPIPQFSFITNSFPTIQNRFYGPGLALVARLTHTFSPTLLNEFVASYTNSYITLADKPAPFVSLQRPAELDQPACSVVPAGGNCGMGSIFANGFGGKLPGIVIGGNNAAYGGNGFSIDTSYMPWEHSNPTYSFSDNFTKMLGRHALSFGAQWVIFQRNQINGPIGAATGDVQGILTYSNEQSSHTTGNAFADFLLQPTEGNAIGGQYLFGGPASFQQDSGQRKYYQRYQIVEPYMQDDWKVTPRFTLNAGLRVSLFGTYHEKNHAAYNWLPTAFNLAASRTLHVANNGQLIDNASGTPVPIYGKNGAPDPRVINGIVQCGVNGVPDGCMSGHLWNPSPRIGFAWDPFGNGKNSIRAGYGIFFEHGTADEANSGSLEGSAPLVMSMTQLNPQGIGCIGNAAAGCSTTGPGAFPLNVTQIPTKAHWSYVQQWSLSIERQLQSHTLASFAYVGSKGTHLTTEREVNQLVPLPEGTSPFGEHDPLTKQECGNTFAQPIGFDGSSYHLQNGATIGPSDPGYINMQAACYGQGFGGGVDPNALREYAPGMGQIYSLENIADSHYSAFQATLRRVSQNLTLGVAYTYSHSTDDASDRSDTTFVNSFDLRSNYASSNFDQRHLLHISYIYELPLLQSLRHFLSNINSNPDPEAHADDHPASYYLGAKLYGLLFDHWQLSGLTLFESGIPFTVVNGGSANGVSVLDNAGVFNGVGAGSYPDKIGSAHGHIPVDGNNANSVGPLLLNPGAFAAPRGLTFGNAGRNVLNNPHRWNFDTALQKHFQLPWESVGLDFRAEAFNVFNHTQFRIYDPTLGTQPQNTASCYGPTSFSAGDSGSEIPGDPGCLNGASFLHPVDAHRPRTIQFGLKLAF